MRDRHFDRVERLAAGLGGLIGALAVGLLASVPRHFVVADMRLPERAVLAEASGERLDLARLVVLAGQEPFEMSGVEICGGFGPGYRLRLDAGV